MVASIIVAGSGLAGSMVALLMAQRGYNVKLIEKRDDIRLLIAAEANTSMGLLANSAKRSINLALSHRGIEALKKVGLFEQIQPLLIPMIGRAVHDTQGKVVLQPYGKSHQAIFSVPRIDLNIFLLNALDKLPNVKIQFNCKVERVHTNGALVVQPKTGEKQTLTSDLVIGADGAFSAIRDSLLKCSRMDYQQEFLEAGYKELTILPTAESEFALKPAEALHIWPRHNFMLIALPNPDKSFTATLFAAWEGTQGLENLKSDSQIEEYFQTHFKDIIPLVPDYVKQFNQNPSSPLLTVRCRPWYHNDNVLLIGDASHAIVPFYGQGMNAAFEDALLFDEIIERRHGQLARSIWDFDAERRPAVNALADLSLQNYVEMSSLTASKVFVLKKKLEALIHAVAPSWWIPLYTMVSFTRIPYDKAKKRAKQQDL